MDNLIIETKNLTKVYGNQTAVNNVNLHVKKGRIYGLLGRNGAGKTTIMKMILGLTSVTSGEVDVFDQNIKGNEKRIYPRIGAIIALMGSYMICREDQDDTMKSLALVPVSTSKLVGAKMIVTAGFSVILYAFLFAITLIVEAALHSSLLKFGMIINFAKIYLLGGICLFLAVSPIIAIVYRLKKGYWLALIFAEIYSFLGLFAGMQGTMRSIYPITAAFCISGYYKTTLSQVVISLCSLFACGCLSLVILHGLNKIIRG